MSFTIKLDYRFDVNGFFDDAARRATLEAAAAEWEMLIRDEFVDIPAGSTFEISDPSNPSVVRQVTLDAPIDDILIFVGARTFPGSTAAVAGPSGYDLAGDANRARISDSFQGGDAVSNFEPWTGTVSFDLDTNWHYTMDEPPSNKLDLFTVAVHELGHVLGVGTSGAFDALIVGGSTPGFNGFNATALNGGVPVPLDPFEGHVADGFAGDIVLLDPTLSSGSRMRPSAYDKAILADIGYDIEGFVTQGSTPPLATNAGETIFGTAFGDTIDGLGGNDQIQTAGGNDQGSGGSGADSIFGGGGNDTLFGGSGADQISGDADNDLIFGDAGNDLLFGGSGADTIKGGADNDQIQAGDGADVIAGGAGNDGIFGEGGADIYEFGLGDGQDQLFDFALQNEVIRLVDSGFNNVAEALAAISKPFSNVSRITLSDGSHVDVFHGQQSGSPLTAAHIELFETQTVLPNSAPTGVIGISGPAAEGSALTAVTSALSDTDGLGAFSYSWFRGAEDTGAVGSSYVLSAADIGAQISVRVSYVDGRGTAETVLSGQTAPIQNVNDAPTGAAILLGIAEEGQTLSVSTNGIADADGLGNFSYTWLRDGAATGASGTTYSLSAADIGAQISVQVSYVDAQGTFEALTSGFSGVVQNVNQSPSGALVIQGNAVEGNTLTLNTSAISDADGLGDFTYTWLRDGSETGITGTSYVLSSADIGAEISASVRYIDGQGSAETVTSATTGAVQNVNDVPTGAVLVQGTLAEGNTLSANVSTVTDPDGLGSFSYVWLRGGIDTGEFGNTYALDADDIDAQISVRVSYVDQQGTPESLTSAQTAAIQNVNDAPVGTVTVTGAAAEGSTLSADTTALFDADGLGSFSYIWLRGSSVTGVTAANYTLNAIDIGAQISVRVSYTDGQGTPENVLSTQTVPVKNVNDAPTGAVVLIGTAAEGRTLSADTSALSDADGLGAFSFEWLRDGENTGATGPDYTLTAADIGTQIAVISTYIDGQGTTEVITSALSATVQNVNSAPTGAVTLSGTPAEGSILIADAQSIDDADGLGSFDFMWLRDGNPFGATGPTYTLQVADIGAVIAVALSYTDGQGSLERVTSAATTPVLNTNAAPQGSVGILGTAVEGSVLSVDATLLSDADGLGPLSYLWLRDDVPTAVKSETYALTALDIGAQISVQITYTDAFSTAETVLSAPTTAVLNINDAPIGVPEIAGTLAIGETLTAVTDSISDADGIGTFSYSWLRDGQATGTTGPTYVVTDADLGGRLNVQVRYTDGFGSQESVLSAQTGAVAAEPTLTGDADDNNIVGTLGDETLTGGAGSDRLEGGGGRDTFDVNPGDESIVIADFEVGTDTLDLLGFGRADILSTLAAAPVGSSSILLPDGTILAFEADTISFDTLSLSDFALAPGDQPATGAPLIVGTPKEGETLTVDIAPIADIDGIDLSTLRYQWQRDGENIAGATEPSLILGQSEVGREITVMVKFQDFTGTVETVASLPSLSVENVNDTATGTLTLSSDLAEGVLAQATLSDVTDADGLSNAVPNYQWLRNGEDIAGANTPGYTIVAEDVGNAISVRLQFTDDLGALETLTSDPRFIFVPGQVLTGTSEGDVIVATAGDDEVDGGEGIDTVFFEGNQASYTLTLGSDSIVITDRRAQQEGGQGTDVLTSIEFLDFGTEIPLFDGPMSLAEIDGSTGLSSADFTDITELYIAYFNRAPDAIGLYFWASAFDQGFDLVQMAAAFFDQDETRETYADVLAGDGKTLTDPEAFITAVYANVLGRAPDQDGFDFWLNQLINNSDITPPSFILSIINGAKFAADPVPQTFLDQEFLATKAELGTYFAAIKGLSNVDEGIAVMSLFDGSDTSLAAAITQADAFYADALDPENGSFLVQLTGVIDDPFAIA